MMFEVEKPPNSDQKLNLKLIIVKIIIIMLLLKYKEISINY